MSHNPSRNFKGLWIPREIWLCKELSLLEKTLWAEIDSLDDPENGCTASNQYFMDFFNVKERVLQEALSHLKKLGFIRYESFDGRIRILRSHLSVVKEKFCTSEVQNSAPLTCGIPHPSPNARHIVYNKEDNKESLPLPPSKPERKKVESPSKEEEEEINRRFRERPKDCPPIKNRRAWELAVLKEIRNAMDSDKGLVKLAIKHKEEAMQWDMKKIGEIMVYACPDRVEFTSGSYCKQVKYRISDEEWNSEVLWKKEWP